jgi:hypothetical protein
MLVLGRRTLPQTEYRLFAKVSDVSSTLGKSVEVLTEADLIDTSNCTYQSIWISPVQEHFKTVLLFCFNLECGAENRTTLCTRLSTRWGFDLLKIIIFWVSTRWGFGLIKSWKMGSLGTNFSWRPRKTNGIGKEGPNPGQKIVTGFGCSRLNGKVRWFFSPSDTVIRLSSVHIYSIYTLSIGTWMNNPTGESGV